MVAPISRSPVVCCVSFLIMAITACSSTGSSPSAFVPTEPIPQELGSSSTALTGIVQNGQVSFSEPIPPSYAGTWRLDIAQTPGLPESLDIEGSVFTAFSTSPIPGQTSYASDLASAFNPITSIKTLDLPVPDGTTVTLQALQPATDATALIYQGNPTQVTLQDVAIALATLQTPQAIAEQASQLLGSPGLITTASLNPAPTPTNLDYVRSGPTPLSIIDVAALLATLQAGRERERSVIASRINQLLGTQDPPINAVDIRLVPGTTLPGSRIVLEAPVQVTGAGFIQISAFVPSTPTNSFTIGAATFVRTSLELYPGFVTFSADAASGFIPLNFQDFQASGLTNSDCLIVHTSPQDPTLPASQRGRSFACGADFPE